MSKIKDKNEFKYLFIFILLICLIWICYLLITNMYFEMIKLNYQEEVRMAERLRVKQGGDLEKKDNREKSINSDKRELKYMGQLQRI